MHKITLRLSDDEYEALKQRADADRRTPREMAERLVTQPAFIVSKTNPYVQQWQYWNPLAPQVWCQSTDDKTAQYTATNFSATASTVPTSFLEHRKTAGA